MLNRRAHSPAGSPAAAASPAPPLPPMSALHDERERRAADVARDSLAAWERVRRDIAHLDHVKLKVEELIDAVDGLFHMAASLPAERREVVDRRVRPADVAELDRQRSTGVAHIVEEQKCIASTLFNLANLVQKRKVLENVSGLERRHGEYSRERDDLALDSRRMKAKRARRERDESPRSSAEISNSLSREPLLRKGHPVAALVSVTGGRGQEWILARVIRFDPKKNKYLIEDEEPDDNGIKAQYLLSRKNVLALPTSPPVGERGYSEYRAGSHILALYPGTTCFYKAMVVEPPSRCRGLFPCSTYIVMFEDDGGREVGIEARLVVQRR